MFTLLMLMLVGAGPTDPTPPKSPEVPTAKAPTAKGPEVVQHDEKVKKGEAQPDAGARPLQAQAVAEGTGVEKKPDAGVDVPPVPPGLSKRALCGEFVKTGKDLAAARKKIDDERKALELDRQALERMKSEIGDARIALRAETERLEKLLATRSGSAGEDTRTPGSAAPERPKTAPVRPQEFDSLARTMKSMKPEAAALLMARTEPALAAAVLKRMKPADAGAVMDRLKPELAADLLALMATIPSAPPTKGGSL